jgi:hypothetical protein
MKRVLLAVDLGLLVAFVLLLGCGREFNRFPAGSTSSITLSSVEPTQGANDADIPIVLHGTNFSGTPRVLVGAVDCTGVTIVTASLLMAVIPADTPAGVYDITVITSTLEEASLTDAFTIIDPNNLTVDSIEPSEGLDDVAVDVVITGTNFVAGATVALGSNTLTTASVIDTETIHATVQPGLTPGVYDVIVTNASSASARLVSGYTVLDSSQLQITEIVPNHGPSDDTTDVAVYGANFDEDMTVLIGPYLLDDVETVASDILTAVVPAGLTPGVYTVRVINSDDEYAELENGYTVDSPGDDDDDDSSPDDDDDDTSPDDDDDNDDNDDNNDNDDNDTSAE